MMTDTMLGYSSVHSERARARERERESEGEREREKREREERERACGRRNGRGVFVWM